MFVSYAQNFEDVILWRALQHVENGFYIDIGAQHPVLDSVSRSFYERGWRGINVEATIRYSKLLQDNRPGDINLNNAVGNMDGVIKLYEIPDTGLSTGDAAIAQRHQDAGHEVVETQAEVIPLAKVFEQSGEREIHWLKIDVEGMEASVIRSWGNSAARPWVLVVEATVPNSPEPNYSEWENDLLARGYQFVYFDGLSRFYVSAEHQELVASFGPGPNFFDGFVLTDASAFVDTSKYDQSLAEIERLKQENAVAASAADTARQKLAALAIDFQASEAKIGTLRAELEQMRKDWQCKEAQHHEKLQFARRLASRIETIKAGASAWFLMKPGSRPRRLARVYLSHAVLWIKRRPPIFALAIRMLRLFPGIHRHAQRFHSQLYAPKPVSQRAQHRSHYLSPRARRILTDIEGKIGHSNENRF